MTRRRILVLSFIPAFNPPTTGGEVRLLHLWNAIAREHDVTLLSSTHSGVPQETVYHRAGFKEVRIPKDERAGAVWDELTDRLGRRELSSLGVALDGRRFTPLHEAYLSHYDAADIIVHAFPFTLEYDLFIGLDAKPRVYDAHNAEFRLADALYPDAVVPEIADYLAALERRLVASSDLIAVCTADDRTVLSELDPPSASRFIVLPNGSEPRPRLDRADRPALPPRAIFIGSDHPPNREAAAFIVQVLAPALPAIVFDIVGNCLGETDLLPANVVRHGRVDGETKTHLLKDADIALNPVVSGSGSNLKVSEYLSYGLPLIATPFGARGFDLVDGQHYLCADHDQFAGALERLGSDIALRRAIGGAGHAHFLDGYTWPAIGARFAAALADLPVGRLGPLDNGIILCLNDYPVSSSIGGGATRIKALYQTLAITMPVVLLTLWEGPGLRTTSLGPGMVEICVGKTEAHALEEVETDALHHASAGDIISLLNASRNPVLLALYGFLRRRARRICIEHIYMVGLPKLFGDRFVLSSHNHELALKQEALAGHRHARALLKLAADAEDYAVSQADLVLGVSAEDLKALSRGRRHFPPSLVVANGVAPPQAAPDELQENARTEIGGNAAVFLGSAHLPNVAAARFLAGKVAPACLDIRFHFIGTVCDSLHDLEGANISLWGQVDEARKSALLRANRLALNPVESGGGSNVKFADYLAHGLPVLTTPFGLRGMPDGILDHVLIAEPAGFADAIAAFFSGARQVASDAVSRARFFDERLSMTVAAEPYGRALRDLGVPRQRILLVTYRYTWPCLGGAEAHLMRFIEALTADDRFAVDIATTDVAVIGSASGFRSTYPDTALGASRPNFPHVAVARFPVDDRMAESPSPMCEAIWAAQPAFEQAWMAGEIDRLNQPALLWGWSTPERHGEATVRRALFEAAVFIPPGGNATLSLVSDGPVSIAVSGAGDAESWSVSFEGPGTLFLPSGGIYRLATAAGPLTSADPRPSVYALAGLSSNGEPIGLLHARLDPHLAGDRRAEQRFDAASEVTRARADLSLTEARGPFSSEMDAWLEQHVGDYDLLVTHNAVFRPAARALAIALTKGVPSVFVPHVHLDDDFYHFPDVHKAVADAAVSFVAPSSAVEFYRERGLDNVRLLGAGVDLDETFDAADEATFRALYAGVEPFVLVLGRKAASKNYRMIIDAVARVTARQSLCVVLIGEDEDGEPVSSADAVYLGPQPRAVVRGALMAARALVTMSDSESFGMVIVEAWLAGTPVIANRNTAAFLDLIQHDVNGLLATPADLDAAIEAAVFDAALSARLAAAGRDAVRAHGWSFVCRTFVDACAALIPALQPLRDS